MIPVTLPITIMIFLFLILIGLSLLLFVGSSYLLRFAKSALHVAASSAPEGETAAASLAPGGPARRIEGYALPDFLRYHPGHSWVAFKESGEAIVGIDDFACKLLGAPKIIASPRIGQRFRQNESGWILRRKGKDLHVPLPLSGEVVQVNERVFQDPALLSRDSYGGGWLAVLKPTNLADNLSNLLQGEPARQWLEKSAAELRAAFSGRLGVVFQDGGLPEDGLADFLDAGEWEKLLARLAVVRPDTCL